MWGFLSGLWSGALSFVGALVQGAVSSVQSFFSSTFAVVWAIADGVWYLITQTGQIVVLSVEIVGQLFNVLFSLGGGLVHTFTNLMTFSPSASFSYGMFGDTFSQAVAILNYNGQWDTLGWVAAGCVWAAEGWAVLKWLRS